MITTLIPTVHADGPDFQSEYIIYMDNGDYIVIELVEYMTRSINGKTGTKNYVYYSADGVARWQASLTGSFTYTGNGCACTAASCDVTIFDGNYFLISKNASRSGNAAYGTVTVGRKILGITYDQNTINLTLTCDVNGNLS